LGGGEESQIEEKERAKAGISKQGDKLRRKWGPPKKQGGKYKSQIKKNRVRQIRRLGQKNE